MKIVGTFPEMEELPATEKQICACSISRAFLALQASADGSIYGAAFERYGPKHRYFHQLGSCLRGYRIEARGGGCLLVKSWDGGGESVAVRSDGEDGGNWQVVVEMGVGLGIKVEGGGNVGSKEVALR
ncbi:hypothetical protein Acr_05g0001680 [Actinidia rufa]|uniref:Uncharacterized protein n=1 Tax=Actinidia rufa TaxID=165716 RepID=A0A7J0EKU1_9ERIC|nr:hypothetical protein Acr_05g0001680 [Actinidia rufa]